MRGCMYECKLTQGLTEMMTFDERTWNLMLAKGFQPKRQFSNDHVTLTGYGNVRLKQVTAFEANIATNVNETRYERISRFYVIENGLQPLLRVRRLRWQSMDSYFFLIGIAEALNILKITVSDMHHSTINAIGGNQIPGNENRMPFPKIKWVVIHLSIKPGVILEQLNLRRTAILPEMVKTKVLELEQQKIIERVSEPSE